VGFASQVAASHTPPHHRQSFDQFLLSADSPFFGPRPRMGHLRSSFPNTTAQVGQISILP